MNVNTILVWRMTEKRPEVGEVKFQPHLKYGGENFESLRRSCNSSFFGPVFFELIIIILVVDSVYKRF